jgi:hypothetical protein
MIKSYKGWKEVNEDNYDYSKQLAKRRSTSPKILYKLAKKFSKDIYVILDISSNTNIDEATVNFLVSLGIKEVDVNLSKNPSTPSEILDKFIQWYSGDIIENVAGNPNTSESTLLYIIGKWSLVDIAIINNPKINSNILDRIIRLTSSPIAIRLAVNNPNISDKTLDYLTNSNSFVERAIVASSVKNTPENLVKLSKDQNSQVRAAAQNNPNFPEDLSSWALGLGDWS